MESSDLRRIQILVGQNVIGVKKASKEALDAAAKEGGPRLRLECALDQVKERSKSDDPLDKLRCFVAIVSALFHHERHGGLQNSQIRSLTSLAHALLISMGIYPDSSRLAVLYSDLHLALSQIYRKSGRPFQAAWEQQLAHKTGKNTSRHQRCLHSLARGTRALRLGHASLAVTAFEEAEDALGLSQDIFERARLGRMRALRLAALPDLATAVRKQSATDGSFTPGFADELAWENLCAEATATGDLQRMVQAVLKSGTHRQASFLVEAVLWAQVVSVQKHLDRLPQMRNLARDKALKPQRLGFIFECAKLLEECRDSAVPLGIRIRKIGDIVANTNRIVTVDRELLVLLAIARWLALTKSHHLAALTLKEYQGLCLKLSDGRSMDVLGTAGDLVERPWFGALVGLNAAS